MRTGVRPARQGIAFLDSLRLRTEGEQGDKSSSMRTIICNGFPFTHH